MPIVYLNGDYIPTEEAKVSILDRGFLYADSVYEVVPVYQQKVLDLSLHIKRLQRSLDAISLKLSVPETQWRSIIQQLIELNQPDQECHKIYIQVTRGALQHLAERQLQPPCSITPTIIVQCIPHTLPATNGELHRGYKVCTHTDIRRQDCFIKSTSLLPSVMIQQQVTAKGLDEAILLRDGFVTEGTCCNVFVVKNNTVLTPPLTQYLLGGITRHLTIKAAKDNDISVLEIPIPQAELQTADEIWLTSSGKEIVPVIELDGRTLPHPKQQKMWQKITQYFQTNTQFKLDAQSAVAE
jgi:D-alanine transaminase